MIRTRACLLATFALSATSAQAGGSVCSVVDSVWKAQHSSTQAAIAAAIDGYSAAITAENALTYQQIISAVRVLTAQRATVDNQVATTDLKANEANASAVTANMTRLAVVKAYETYGDQGQAPDGCEVAQRLSDFSQSIENAGSAAKGFTVDAGIDVRPGGTPQLDAVIQTRLEKASATTLDVTKTLLDPDASDEDVTAFINNLTGLPMQKTSIGGGGVAAGAGNAAGAIQNVLASRMEAYRSPALVSLGYIRAIRRGGTGAHTPSTENVREHLDWIKARYGGGPEYEAWAAKMATKSEPGILKEITRIRSLTMAVRKLREASTSRMTVLVGSMVAQEAAQR